MQSLTVLNFKMDDSKFPLKITDLSPELLCNIFKCLPLREVLSVSMLCRKLAAAANMHLQLCKSIDFCPDEINGYMPSSITDQHMQALFKKCPHLETIYGLNPIKEERRKLRKRPSLTVHGVIEALKLCSDLKGIGTSDLRLLEAVLLHLPEIEIIGHFQNRDGAFPPLASQKLRLTSFPRLNSLHLTGVEVPELTPMPNLQHLYLQCVRFTKLHPFRLFSAQNLKSFVMKHCMGPAMSLRYLSLVIALSSCPNLTHLEFARVPLPGGVFQRAVEDSHKQNGFVNLKTLVISGCKGILEVDLGHLMIVSSKNLETLFIQPSLTKDSLFVSLSFAQCTFPSLQNLHLGYLDVLNHSGEWSNSTLISLGLADVPDTPSSITDSGMKTISQIFPHIKSLTVSNCPHLMVMYQWMPSPNINAWLELTHLTLQKNHCLQLSSFTHFVSRLPCIEVIVLNDMFKEPPKGCSHVGLSAGTGLGMSSAVVSNHDEHMAVQGHHQEFDLPGDDEIEELERELDEENQEPHFMVLRGDFFEEDDDIDYIDYETRYFNELRREANGYSSDYISESSDDNTDNEAFISHSHSRPTTPIENNSENVSSISNFKNENNNSINFNYKYCCKQILDSCRKSSESAGVQVKNGRMPAVCDQSINVNKEYSNDIDVKAEDLKSSASLQYDPHQPSTSNAGRHFNCSDVSDSDAGSNYKFNYYLTIPNEPRKLSSLISREKTKDLEQNKKLSSKPKLCSNPPETDHSVCNINETNFSYQSSVNQYKMAKHCHVHLTRVEDEISLDQPMSDRCVPINLEPCMTYDDKSKHMANYSEQSKEGGNEEYETISKDTWNSFPISKEAQEVLNDRGVIKAMKCYVLVSKIDEDYGHNDARSKKDTEISKPVYSLTFNNNEENPEIIPSYIKETYPIDKSKVKGRKSKKRKLLKEDIHNAPSSSKGMYSFSNDSVSQKLDFKAVNSSCYDPCQPSTSKITSNSHPKVESLNISCNIKSEECSSYGSEEIGLNHPKKHEHCTNDHNPDLYCGATDCYVLVKHQLEDIGKIDCSKIKVPKLKGRSNVSTNLHSVLDNNDNLSVESSSDSFNLPLSKRIKTEPDELHHNTPSNYIIMAPCCSTKFIKICNITSHEVSEAAWCSIPLPRIDDKKISEVSHFQGTESKAQESSIPLNSDVQSKNIAKFNPDVPSTSKAKSTYSSESCDCCDPRNVNCFKFRENELSMKESFAGLTVKRSKSAKLKRKKENSNTTNALSNVNCSHSGICFAPKYTFSSIRPEAIRRHHILKVSESDAISMSVVPMHSSATSLTPKAFSNQNDIAVVSSQPVTQIRRKVKRKRSSFKTVGKKTCAAAKSKSHSKFGRRCQKRNGLENKGISIPVISLVSQGTQANSADIRRSLRRVRRVTSQKALSSFTVTKSKSSRSSRISARIYERRPIYRNHYPDMQNKSTSTSDPLLEDDAVQILQLSSDTLLSFTIVACGISNLIIDRCPKLFHLEVQACRIFKRVQLNICPAIKRVNISQCPKLNIHELAHATLRLETESYFLVSYEPCMQNYHFGECEYAILKKTAPNQSVLVCHDFHEPSSETIEATFKEKILEWLPYLSRLHATLNYSRKKIQRMRNNPSPPPEYPWSHHALRRIHGEYAIPQPSELPSTVGRYNVVTNNPVFAELFETRLNETFPSVSDCEAFTDNTLLSFEAIEKHFQMQKKFIGFYIPVTEYNRIETYKHMQRGSSQ